MMTNIMVKACLNQEIMKISNLIPEKIKNNACPRPKFNRRPNLWSESLNQAEFHRMFRSSEVWIEHTTW